MKTGHQDKNVTMARNMALASNYHRWVFDSFKNYLKPNGRTLEVGAGHGGYTKLLSNLSQKVIATDIDIEAIAKIKDELIPRLRNAKCLIMDGVEPHKIPEPVDNIVAVNVIEHMKDNSAFMRDCFSVLKSDGRIIIFAPAFQFLFCNMDKEAGHFRRYQKKDMISLLKNSGFRLVAVKYFNFMGFWGWLINKYMGSGVDSEITNKQVIIFDSLIWLFRPLDIFSFLCGQSVIAVGEKE